MFALTIIFIWMLLMLRSGIAEYRYYQSVKILEPKVWSLLGTPQYLKIPMVFLSTKNRELLMNINNKAIRELAEKHRRAGIQLLAYVVSALVICIMYFKLA